MAFVIVVVWRERIALRLFITNVLTRDWRSIRWEKPIRNILFVDSRLSIVDCRSKMYEYLWYFMELVYCWAHARTNWWENDSIISLLHLIHRLTYLLCSANQQVFEWDCLWLSSHHQRLTAFDSHNSLSTWRDYWTIGARSVESGRSQYFNRFFSRDFL